jgi:hypothetical protein
MAGDTIRSWPSLPSGGARAQRLTIRQRNAALLSIGGDPRHLPASRRPTAGHANAEAEHLSAPLLSAAFGEESGPRIDGLKASRFCRSPQPRSVCNELAEGSGVSHHLPIGVIGIIFESLRPLVQISSYCLKSRHPC